VQDMTGPNTRFRPLERYSFTLGHFMNSILLAGHVLMTVLTCMLRCGEITRNEFGSSIFVGKPVYIYTKVIPFIKNWREKIFSTTRTWLGKFCRPPFRPNKNILKCRLHCIQNNRLCNTVPTKQSVNKPEYVRSRYPLRRVSNSLAKPNRQYLALLGAYLGPTYSD
jgi:hypothetical protein